MKKYTKHEQATIVTASAHEFDRQVNDVLDAASSRGAEITGIDRRREGGEFIAFIDMVSEVKILESIMDGYQDRGECYKCGECPHMLRSGDKRRRYHQCEMGMREQTRWNSPACLYFYEALDRGEIDVDDIIQEKEVRRG